MRRLLLFIGLELLVISMAVLLIIFDISKIDNILYIGVPLIILIYILFGFKRPAFIQSGFVKDFGYSFRYLQCHLGFDVNSIVFVEGKGF